MLAISNPGRASSEQDCWQKSTDKPAAGNWFAGKRDLLLGLIPCHCMTLVLVSKEQPAREE
uniref:Uncharacterized protein n=1 Tax=Escherichia coli TaxID=562 RepID=A0A0N9DZN8_ECOLX|nr:hypothetical protein AZ95_0052 [Escherichia coli]